MSTYAALLAELDGALAAGGSIRHTTMLQRLTELFQLGADNYSDDQIAVFDDVFVRLVSRIETSARSALAARLAPMTRAPPALTRILASDNEIDVAAPVLRHCPRLGGATLAEFARTKSQAHLLAISLRDFLDRSVTDILIDRGDRAVLLSTARNPGALFSEFGFSAIIARAKGDDELAASIGARRELPRRHLLKLLAQASDTARGNLESDEAPGAGAVKDAVAEATASLQAMTSQAARTYEAAERCVDALQAAGELDEAAVATFAKAHQAEEATVALARLCNMPLETIETAMAGERPESILILGKAAGLTWTTVKSVLALRRNGQGVSAQTLESCLGTFSRMKPATAREVLDFQRRRGLQQAQIV